MSSNSIRVMIEKDGQRVYDENFDNMDMNVELGIKQTIPLIRYAPPRFDYNGQKRAKITLWAGCPSFDAFQPETEEVK